MLNPLNPKNAREENDKGAGGAIVTRQGHGMLLAAAQFVSSDNIRRGSRGEDAMPENGIEVMIWMEWAESRVKRVSME
ncbi:hypothetical protein CALCODRAFT_490437 [Calocera cornea HHB12733]|uniref:Uncharacterized protein n=1 Tax=Calocera cornea HHB12733 TaxID=1353952 RepID=A0A165JT30_9BASI|nr:hypothetical protein CALCODRAFT_490437 [Calocera cornea HHB12733]